MDRNLRITAVGDSGAGKTCFLYGMYAEMAFGINGFTIIPNDYDKSLSLEEGWRMIVEEEKWPDGTDSLRKIDFDLSYSLKPLFTFQWHDYKGGLWEQANSKETKELISIMENSSSILLFIPATVIKGILNLDFQAKRKLARLQAILGAYGRYTHDQGNDPNPIGITITKADLLEDGELEQAIVLLRNQYLQTIFQKGGKWPVIITAVSLGRDLKGKQGEPVQGIISPKNLHLPILFSIYIAVSQLIRDELEELNYIQSAQKTAKNDYQSEINKSGWQKFWNGDKSSEYKNSLSSIEKELDLQKEKLNNLKIDLERIESEIHEGCVIFLDGQKMQFKKNN